jgi:carbonic anhydrase
LFSLGITGKVLPIMNHRTLGKIPLSAAMGLMLIVLSACVSARAGEIPDSRARATVIETPHWSYEGDTGPEYWYALDPAYAIAGEGKAQSPIDIVDTELILNGAPAKPVFAYRKTLFEIENNGHTIELLPAAAGNRITLDGKSYELRQFHFHTPSEHLINGAPFAMEMHLVHQDAGGDLAVVGVMIVEGERNETLREVFERLPGEPGVARPEVELNLAELFSGSGGMYRYDGSLTTPPCTEGVKWSVAMAPIEMSSPQIDAFRARYRGNSRPVQNRYGRPVYAAE